MTDALGAHRLLVIATATLATVTTVSIALWWQSKRKKYHKLALKDVIIPEKWIKIGEVKELVMYPLKGARRRCIEQVECTQVGFKLPDQPGKIALHDRLFVLFNDKHEFLSIKKNTKVLFVETEAFDDSRVKFTFPDSQDLIVQIPSEDLNMNHIEIYFGEKVKTVDCGPEAAEWFSQRLLGQSSGLRLGCFVQSLVPARSLEGSYDKHAQAYTKFHSDYMRMHYPLVHPRDPALRISAGAGSLMIMVGNRPRSPPPTLAERMLWSIIPAPSAMDGTYHNLASYMLMSEASITDLNARISRSPVTEHYFRPNIVVRGSDAYSEDTWDWIKIGDNVVLRGFKHCIRCTITTVDPDTGARDPKVEPLKTLRSYRQIQKPELRRVDGPDPVMGLYAGCHRTGTIQVGDPVYISDE